MKRILFLTPFAPSNNAGAEKFTRLLLKHLSKSFKVDLVYFRYVDDIAYECPNENVRVVKEVTNSTIVKLRNAIMYPFVHPIFSVRFDRKLLYFIQDLVKKNSYNLLFLDHSQMALYGKFFPDVRKILMSHDVMAQRFARTGNWLNRKLVVAGERKMMHLKNTTVFSFSEKDRKIIYETYGIDSKVTNFFLDNKIIDATPSKIEKRIVFIGKWKRLDNFEGLKWFFDTVYNHIEKTIEICIIGKWLPTDFQNLILSYSNVHYLGFVENPYPLIANSIATISPLFSGAGVKVKVVESIACGTPVIGTEIAFEGISEKYSQMMILANNADEYVKALKEIISLEERQNIKKNFISNYISDSIPEFLKTIL